jgi:hypothetical protein
MLFFGRKTISQKIFIKTLGNKSVSAAQDSPKTGTEIFREEAISFFSK